ncbi:MAG: PqqD family protein [Zetaproteobacteria bacterium CG12_big_fil_rev_8_21_14_0_65_54_13]|nr:MAG: PqqD family protein [Zetaproteobacteria bacterium CG12_big_fil_rev_8_21_14_0_65_54_13]PIX54039.1 MAG: PqqD family protein [Zetaproteobacteria bacterium CG_4_10_14_3_um_filter_54_28]PJA30484.1 MAG: PqqD family protein [Zetaproteobacteria bacterium CG_4_9_14_3_um_filter_54_145]
MALNMSDVVRRNPEIVHSDMDGETVMMSVNEGSYYGLNGVGSQIWELLEQEMSVDAICTELLGHFDVEEKQCCSEVLAFLEEMSTSNVIEIA